MTRLATKTAAAAALALMAAGPAAIAQTDTAGGTDNTQSQAAAQAQQIGLSQAITAAEQEIEGARAFEAELETEDGRPSYETKVVDSEQGIHEITIDAETGEVTSREEQAIESLRRRWLNNDELTAVTGAEISLAEVVTNVETQTGAAVQETEIDSEDDRVVYEMELLTANGEEMEVTVDAETGEILEQETDD